jgi:aflatoxin B1 aldehyde reductase
MAPTEKTNLPVVLGCMTLGDADHWQTRIKTKQDEEAFLDAFVSHGHTMLDTSMVYGGGSSESHLGQLSLPARGLMVATKIYPTKGRYPPPHPQLTHEPDVLRTCLNKSLAALNTDKIDMYYLHAPDLTTPFAVTIRALATLQAEGKFSRWGISNFTVAQVREVLDICAAENLPKPAVYQGLYNALHRAVEAELIPLLHEHGIAFYAFNPLAGGMLTDRYSREKGLGEVEEGGRFDAKTVQGKAYVERYWNGETWDALELVGEVAGRHGLGRAECALRWMMWHSMLSKEMGDAVIVGASGVQQLQGNLEMLEGRELPGDVVEALDEGWEKVRGLNTKFWH